MYLPSSRGMIVNEFEDIRAIIKSHFGRKPVSGGNPPNERRRRINILLEAKDKDVIFITWADVFTDNLFNRINIGDTTTTYSEKYVMVK
jgi:hypothetical protein